MNESKNNVEQDGGSRRVQQIVMRFLKTTGLLALLIFAAGVINESLDLIFGEFPVFTMILLIVVLFVIIYKLIIDNEEDDDFPEPAQIIKHEREIVKLQSSIEINERNEHLPKKVLHGQLINRIIPEILENASIIEMEMHSNDKYMICQIELLKPEKRDA